MNGQIRTNCKNITEIIKNLKNKKAPGIDGINNMCLKALPKKGIQYITFLINSCLKNCYFPNQFKEAKVVPIRKPNKPYDNPTSYRPISLLSSISKILEKTIKVKILEHIENNNILPPQQFGFRREHNTMHPLVRIKKIVKSNFMEQKSTAMVLLDIKSAFDSVWHNALIYKMIKLNFNDNIIKITQCFLSNRSFRVFIGSKSSKLFYIKAGCPQGSCLSPILYNIFTSDIIDIANCETSVFADDTAILSSGFFATNIINNLEQGLSSLKDYFIKWKICLNYNKTQAIYFTRKRKSCFLPQRNMILNNQELNWESTVKYLGIILDKKVTFKEHIGYIIHKCNTLIRTLYPFINKKSSLNISNKMLIFKSVFHAVMFYGAPVWAKSANCHLRKLQVLQNKLLKLLYNKPRLYSTARIHDLAGTELITDKMLRLCTKFYEKCSYSDYNHLNELVS